MMTRRDLLGGMALALRRDRLDEAIALVRKAAASGEVRWAALDVRQGSFRQSLGFGKAEADTVFILASISKPMTVTGVMVLADRGELQLSDPVRKFIPEFQGGDRDLITVRHVLNHTSGLPDMLPENVDLRKRHAPLSDFVAAACKTPLLFKPGTQVRYQSTGILLAAEVARRITKTPTRDFLRTAVFEPLGMSKTSVGLGGRRIEDTALIQLTGNEDWNGNSPYWRNLGAPWGAFHSTAPDVTRFLEAFLYPEGRVLKVETARAMISNQTQPLDTPWGLGWMIKPGTFGRKCSPETFGHYGSSGTVAWADPRTKITCVLLTTRPAAQSRAGLLGPVSDLVAEAA
jgi:beta-lactamase class C